MEIGSKEHKQLLYSQMSKTLFKTLALITLLGLALIAPSFLRENTFSLGLAYAGQGILVFGYLYAFAIAFKKYRLIQTSLQKVNLNQGTE